MDVPFLDDDSCWSAGGNRRRLLMGIAVLVVAVCILACRMLFCGGSVAEVVAAEPEGGEELAADAGEACPSAASEEPVVVYVSGAVVAPGVYELSAGARVGDAVKAAGGFAEGAVEAAVNLARLAQDGEQVHIPYAEEAVADGVAGGAVAGSGLVNLNTATASELESLPGIGPATAQKIVAEREANGAFSSVDDLVRVNGIGEKKVESLRDSATV